MHDPPFEGEGEGIRKVDYWGIPLRFAAGEAPRVRPSCELTDHCQMSSCPLQLAFGKLLGASPEGLAHWTPRGWRGGEIWSPGNAPRPVPKAGALRRQRRPAPAVRRRRRKWTGASWLPEEHRAQQATGSSLPWLRKVRASRDKGVASPLDPPPGGSVRPLEPPPTA